MLSLWPLVLSLLYASFPMGKVSLVLWYITVSSNHMVTELNFLEQVLVLKFLKSSIRA